MTRFKVGARVCLEPYFGWQGRRAKELAKTNAIETVLFTDDKIRSEWGSGTRVRFDDDYTIETWDGLLIHPDY